MRVLHVVGGFGVGGVETWLRDLVRSCPDLTKQWSFCLLADEIGELAGEVAKDGCTIIRCPLRPAVTFPVRFWALLRRGRYDVVHSHVLLFSGVALAIAALAGVRGRVAHGHNSHDSSGEGPWRLAYRWAMRRLLRLAAGEVVGCSTEALRFLGRGRILPYGLPLGDDGGSGDEGRDMWRPYPRKRRLVGSLGRLVPQKKFGRLIEAFAETADELELVIWGEGPLREELEDLIGRSGLTGRVSLPGKTDRPLEALASLDAFVMPSLYEGLPRALLEAQAAGLPCLISDAVSDEAIVLPELVERAPLVELAHGAARGSKRLLAAPAVVADSGNRFLPVAAPGGAPLDWAQALARAVKRPRLSRAEADRRMRAAGFDLAGNERELRSVYAGALCGRAA